MTSSCLSWVMRSLEACTWNSRVADRSSKIRFRSSNSCRTKRWTSSRWTRSAALASNLPYGPNFTKLVLLEMKPFPPLIFSGNVLLHPQLWLPRLAFTQQAINNITSVGCCDTTKMTWQIYTFDLKMWHLKLNISLQNFTDLLQYQLGG